MKKLILQNTLAPQLLIYGGLALVMWPSMLRALGVMNYGDAFTSIFLYIGLATTLAGVVLRLYQQQQMGQSALRSYFLRFAFGITIVVIMMMTGLVRTPAFLQNLF
ncbi:hypothetical protein [Pontibacter sp. HSC-36F09]|uniref:hypothetical protein n=1 Tax=Pontibacter sp. HSC-36F09 TaxID=2910966 RepID=UPI00209F2DAA|nr:hypothetical protein [Pontibacter sp. HSC-36F09]MCP2042426.1 hypothetical protein [Pontibacter sp. HSC-36F09]